MLYKQCNIMQSKQVSSWYSDSLIIPCCKPPSFKVVHGDCTKKPLYSSSTTGHITIFVRYHLLHCTNSSISEVLIFFKVVKDIWWETFWNFKVCEYGLSQIHKLHSIYHRHSYKGVWIPHFFS